MSLASSFHAATDVLIPAGRGENEWPPQGKWTYEDYCRLPEDGWIYEIIEGELYMSPAPKTIHQKCGGRLFAAFLNFAQRYDLGEPYYSPIDVILPGLANPVQPDVIFIVKERFDIIKEERVEGAPDIIVESRPQFQGRAIFPFFSQTPDRAE